MNFLEEIIKIGLFTLVLLILVFFVRSCDVHAISYDDLTNSTNITVSGFNNSKPSGPWLSSFVYGDSNPVIALNLPNPNTYPNLAIYFPTSGKLQKGHRYSFNFYYSSSGYFDFSNSKYWYDGGSSNVKSLNDFKSIQTTNSQITNMWGWGNNLIANYTTTTFVFDIKEDLTTDFFSFSFKNLKQSNNNLFIGGYTIDDLGSYVTEQDVIDNENKNHQEAMDTITDSSVDSDSISSLGGTSLPTSGPLSAILNLPINFFTNLINNLDSNTCNPIQFTLPFIDYDVSIPCFRNLLENMGALTFYESIGALAGGIAIFNYVLYMGRQFKKMQDLESGDGEFGGL